MRSSLEGDWSYLTTEMKTTLVGASMEAHPANDDMLAIIRNVETNPSRCSCSQIAPTEYNSHGYNRMGLRYVLQTAYIAIWNRPINVY